MINFDEVNKLIATCLMGKVEGVDFGEFSEHDWEKSQDGTVNSSAFEYDGCEGVFCTRCNHYECVEHEKCYINDDVSITCSLPIPNYRNTYYFKRLLPIIKERCIIQITVLEETHCYLTLKDGYKELGRAYYSHGVGGSINEAVCLAMYHMLKGEYENE